MSRTHRVRRCPDHLKYHTGCPGCRRYGREYNRARHRAVAMGRWEPTLEGEQIEPVRAHVRGLLATPGITVPRVAATAGLNYMAVYRLLNGTTVQLWPLVAHALLGVTVERVQQFVQPAYVDGIGAARRLQAMAVEQWSSRDIAGLLSASASSIGHLRQLATPSIRRETHEAVAELYEKVQGLPDPLGPSPRVALLAAKAGYLGPERWDDDTIDDPDAQPLPLAGDTLDMVELLAQRESAMRLRTPGAGAPWPREFKRAMAGLARQAGWPLADVAAVLGMSTSGVEYLLNGRKDRPHTRR